MILINADIYIAVVSSAHNVCPKGYYIAIVSTIAESSANHHLELAPGFERLGRIEEKFMVNILENSPCSNADFLSRVLQFLCTSLWKAASMTISLYLRATMQQVILRLQPTMSKISIAELKAMSWLLKD